MKNTHGTTDEFYKLVIKLMICVLHTNALTSENH